jgi:hypothetical protein
LNVRRSSLDRHISYLKFRDRGNNKDEISNYLFQLSPKAITDVFQSRRRFSGCYFPLFPYFELVVFTQWGVPKAAIEQEFTSIGSSQTFENLTTLTVGHGFDGSFEKLIPFPSETSTIPSSFSIATRLPQIDFLAHTFLSCIALIVL